MPKQSEASYSSQLKGIAICAVVILHLLTTLPQLFHSDPQHTAWFAIIDQSMRFCVPLFVALSGFGLTKKYLRITFRFSTFLKRRVLKLFPLYIVWSIASLLIFTLSPVWVTSLNALPLWWKLILGRSDYHLYFVPMIFQLYLLFPVLLWTLRRWSKATLLTSLLLQVGAYAFYYSVVNGYLTSTFVWNDQRQYLTSISWIFYFVLGMWLATVEEKKRHPFLLGGAVALITGFCLSIWTGLGAMNTNADTIMMLRSTRLPLMVYSSGFIVVMLAYVETFIQPFRTLFSWVGKHSYLIYLAHPLFLRLMLALSVGDVEPFSIFLASCIYIVASFVSLRYFSAE